MLDIKNLDEEGKTQLTFQLAQILESWQLSDEDQLTILGLSKIIKPRHLYQYRRGNKSFDFDQALNTRTEIILGIYEALGTTYPTNRDYASIWLKRPVKKFKHKAPLELMLSGEVGLKRVWHFLDCTQNWQN